MAIRVPTIEGPSVEQRPLATPMQRSSATPTLLQNNQPEQMGRALTELGAQIQQREDADALMRAETDIKGRYVEWEAAAKQRQGQQAWGITKDAGDWWDREAPKVGDNLTPSQRSAFDRGVQRLKVLSQGTFAQHEAVQRRESLTQSAQASIVGSINMAAANAGNPEVVAASKGDLLKRSQMLAQLNGWSPEMAEAKQAEYLTNFHKQILQNMVDRDPAAAEAYFKTNRGEISGSEHGEIEKTFKLGASMRRAQAFGDEVMTSGMDEAAALAEARKRYEGEDEKAAVLEVKTRFAERSGAREHAQRDAADEAWSIYGRTGNLSSIPASVLSRLDGKDLAAMRNDQQSRLDREANRADREANRAERAANRLPQTDWERYYALRREGLEDPQKFKQRDLRREFPYLGKAEREGLIDLQTKADKPDELKDSINLSQQLSDTHDILRLSGKQNEERRGRFDQVVGAAIRAEEVRLHKKLDYDARQQIIDKMIVQGTVTKDWWPDPTKRRYEVVGTPEEEAFVPNPVPAKPATKAAPAAAAPGRAASGMVVPAEPEITVPPAERAKIEDTLRRRNLPVTDDAVKRLYLRKVGV